MEYKTVGMPRSFWRALEAYRVRIGAISLAEALRRIVAAVREGK